VAGSWEDSPAAQAERGLEAALEAVHGAAGSAVGRVRDTKWSNTDSAATSAKERRPYRVGPAEPADLRRRTGHVAPGNEMLQQREPGIVERKVGGDLGAGTQRRQRAEEDRGGEQNGSRRRHRGVR
jgi:hypothetical protein